MIKNVDESNLGNVWEKVAELLKKLIGDVNIRDKGTLQVQIDNVNESLKTYGQKIEYDNETSKLKLKNGDEVISEITIPDGSGSKSTINVTTEDEIFFEKTITASIDGIIVGTGTFSDSGTASIKIVGTGNVTISSEGIQVIVNVPIAGAEYEVVMIGTPDGDTVEPINDVAIWLKCAEVTDKNYTELNQLLEDETTLYILMSDENAMKYLARSTGFAEVACANESFMTYLGSSAWVDTTVLNSDLWVSAISSSSYWDLIYPSVTVHSSASATITVAGKSFTSDVSGNTIHSMPWGTFSIYDSVSGQSFECTIKRDTSDVYVMPSGVLYWYGNECTWITGGWRSTVGESCITFRTNDIYATGSYDVHNYVSTNNKICLNGLSKLTIKFIKGTANKGNTEPAIIIDSSGNMNIIAKIPTSNSIYTYTDRVESLNFSQRNDSQYIGVLLSADTVYCHTTNMYYLLLE